VHGYTAYAAHESDTPREQLPPDSANFIFVSRQTLHLPTVFNKLTPHEFFDIRQKINNAARDAPSPPCCTPSLCCILLPVVGWCYLCNQRAELEKAAQKEATYMACQQITAEYSGRGITVQYHEFEDVRWGDGFIIEVQPFLSTGAPNPLWTGPVPVLDANTKQALMMDYQMWMGRAQSSDLPRYEDVYAQSSEALNNTESRLESVKGLAHNTVLASWFANVNPTYYGPLAQQADAQFRALCAQLGLDAATNLQNATEDLTQFQSECPEDVDLMRVTNTTDPSTAVAYLKQCQDSFAEAAALPPPPAYDQFANANAPPMYEVKGVDTLIGSGANAYAQPPPLPQFASYQSSGLNSPLLPQNGGYGSDAPAYNV